MTKTKTEQLALELSRRYYYGVHTGMNTTLKTMNESLGLDLPLPDADGKQALAEADKNWPDFMKHATEIMAMIDKED